MMEQWKPYPKNRKICFEEEYAIIVPEAPLENGMPLFCEVCDFAFFSIDDEKSYSEFKCCSMCADEWAYAYKEKWKNGWRPTEDQMILYLKKRSIVSSDIVIE